MSEFQFVDIKNKSTSSRIQVSTTKVETSFITIDEIDMQIKSLQEQIDALVMLKTEIVETLGIKEIVK
jgi:hypothetical protein